jgi:hypothetical protein
MLNINKIYKERFINKNFKNFYTIRYYKLVEIKFDYNLTKGVGQQLNCFFICYILDNINYEGFDGFYDIIYLINENNKVVKSLYDYSDDIETW